MSTSRFSIEIKHDTIRVVSHKESAATANRPEAFDRPQEHSRARA